MANPYSNVPSTSISNSSDATIQAFDAYFSAPLELKAGVFDSINGFFTARGFDITAAQTITVVIMRQAKIDGFNPMQVLDTLKGLDNVEISRVVSEIINLNRYKTSFLGYAAAFVTNQEVARNVLA